MHLKSFIKLLTPSLKGFLWFYVKNLFYCQKATRKQKINYLFGRLDKFSREQLSSVLLFIKSSAPSYFLDNSVSTLLYILIFNLLMEQGVNEPWEMTKYNIIFPTGSNIPVVSMLLWEIKILKEIEITFPSVSLLCLHLKTISQRYFLSFVHPEVTTWGVLQKNFSEIFLSIL